MDDMETHMIRNALQRLPGRPQRGVHGITWKGSNTGLHGSTMGREEGATQFNLGEEGMEIRGWSMRHVRRLDKQNQVMLTL